MTFPRFGAVSPLAMVTVMVLALLMTTASGVCRAAPAPPPRGSCIDVPSREGDVDNPFVPAAALYARARGPRVAGQPTVVFVHGTSASNLYWRCVQERVAEDGLFTVAVDLRGHGQSEQTNGSLVKYTYELFARDIASMLEFLGVDGEIYWAGISIGASIGVEFNSLYPGRITRMALFGYTPLFASPGCTQYGCVPNAPSTPESLLNEPCQADPLLQQAQAAIVQNKARAGPIIPNLIANGWIKDQSPLLPLVTAPTSVAFGSIDSLLGGGNSSRFVHAHIENSVLVEHVNKGHLLIISDWYQAYRDLARIFRLDALPDFTRVLDKGCVVCPLVKPVSEPDFVPCTYTRWWCPAGVTQP
ncbi:hypothetical protein [Mollivirus kamchatka]|nr:hypothetical protein [Mollivirus kamchatka]